MTKPFRLKAPKPLESALQAQIMDYLAMEQARGRVIWFCRVNSGAVKFGLRYIRYYLLYLGGAQSSKGKADIEGMLSEGRYFALEVKRPGEQPTDEQVKFLDAVKAGGGIAAVVHGFDDVKKVLFETENKS
jgi:hypothetical protein